MFYQKFGYIHMNPVEAGFVEKAGDYSCGSAGFLYLKRID